MSEWRDDDPVETIACPHCGRQIYEEAERCPDCGQYVSREDSSPGKPLWIVVGAILCLVAVYFWVVR